jgi:hypothetical protein
MTRPLDAETIRQRILEASEEDNCGGSDDYGIGYRQCGVDLLTWWDTETVERRRRQQRSQVQPGRRRYRTSREPDRRMGPVDRRILGERRQA